MVWSCSTYGEEHRRTQGFGGGNLRLPVDQMVWSCSTYGGEHRRMQGFGGGNLRLPVDQMVWSCSTYGESIGACRVLVGEI